MSANQKAKYVWSEDTVSHFQFTRAYQSESEVKEEIKDFVEHNCEYTDQKDYLSVCEDLFGVVSGKLDQIE